MNDFENSLADIKQKKLLKVEIAKRKGFELDRFTLLVVPNKKNTAATMSSKKTSKERVETNKEATSNNATHQNEIFRIESFQRAIRNAIDSGKPSKLQEAVLWAALGTFSTGIASEQVKAAKILSLIAAGYDVSKVYDAVGLLD